MYDIRADERLMRVFMQEGGIRSLAFRSGTSRPSVSVIILDVDFLFTRTQMVRRFFLLLLRPGTSLSGT